MNLPISPLVVLCVLIALTVAAALYEAAARSRRRRALRQLAARWQMTYSPQDRLRVRDKIAGRLPIPVAADLYVTDVIYGGEGERYRYVFTAEYTLGVVRTKRRELRVATFCEPRSRACAQSTEPINFAPEDLPILQQYEHLAPASRQ